VANEEEQRNPEEEPGGPEEELSQDPFVEKVRPDPSEPPIPIRVFEGLLGKSDREGYWRLYFSRELDNYAEFRQDDVVFSEPIPPDEPPFLGLDATRIGIRRDATIEYTRVRAPRPVDEFDLDVRLMDPTKPPPEDLAAGWRRANQWVEGQILQRTAACLRPLPQSLFFCPRETLICLRPLPPTLFWRDTCMGDTCVGQGDWPC
jgi:hypothetical protein